MTNSYNEIWVVSDFCKEILLKHECKRPIFVLPDSIDIELYNTTAEPYVLKPSLNKFIFLFVGSWTYRKGYDVLLKAYLNEFNDKDDVSLLVMSRHMMGIGGENTIRDEIQKYINNCGKDNPPHIARCSKVIPENLMPSIYRSCNALALFSRGEAFSLTPCEASLCGIPIISTKCSGQTMFLNDENSYLLNIDKISPLPQGLSAIHYWDNHLFPELKSDNTIIEARKLLREVYENYNDAKKKNKKLSKFVKENYNIDNISLLAQKRLIEIWEKFK
jgi:glycosyltransferase involved in cell wall biosynthesis